MREGKGMELIDMYHSQVVHHLMINHGHQLVSHG